VAVGGAGSDLVKGGEREPKRDSRRKVLNEGIVWLAATRKEKNPRYGVVSAQRYLDPGSRARNKLTMVMKGAGSRWRREKEPESLTWPFRL
jgi:hypothetical protein